MKTQTVIILFLVLLNISLISYIIGAEITIREEKELNDRLCNLNNDLINLVNKQFLHNILPSANLVQQSVSSLSKRMKQ